MVKAIIKRFLHELIKLMNLTNPILKNFYLYVHLKGKKFL